MRIEGRTMNGARLFFSISDVLQVVPKDGEQLPCYIMITHLVEDGKEQYYTAFTASGVRDLIQDLQDKLETMERDLK